MPQFDPKKLGEEADELIRNQTKSTDTGDTPDGTQEAAVEPVVGDVADDAIAQVDSTATTDQGQQSGDASEGSDAADTTVALAGMQKQLDTAEQRWKVLQGMITKKDEELDTLRGLLGQMNTSPAPQEQAAQVASLVTDADVKEYGQEYVDFITRVASQAVRAGAGNSPELASLAARLSLMEGSVQGVEQTSATTAQSMFLSELSGAVPGWKALNTDASFLQWLDQVDTFTGATRQELLKHAVSQQDAARAATFFAAYQQETTAPAQVAAPQAAAPRKAGKESLVAPGKTRAAAPSADTKRNWTRAEIAKLYDDKMAGKVTAAEFDKLERDIFAAQADGRIAA